MRLELLNRLDLNLLIVLHVLLEERNGSRAARRLHLSQSAVSKALSRLRETLGDPLFLRTSHGLEPTPRALQLEQELIPLLHHLDGVLHPPRFDPATTEREFLIASMDSAFTLFVPLYLQTLTQQAPGVRLRYVEWDEGSLGKMAQGGIDLAFTVRENSLTSDLRIDTLPSTIEQRLLAKDGFTCLVRQDHPLLGLAEWGVEAFSHYPHVQTFCEGRDRWMLDDRLQEMGVSRHIATTVPSFEAALRMGMHSDMIVTVSSLYARHAVQVYPMVPLPLPIRIDSISHLLVWHQGRQQDPGHRWLRETLHTLITNELRPDEDHFTIDR
ncbi:LysR substrate-binding domain-containing protein [Aeromonas diversa]|uniref:LysR substrate-binding domain-containing protein n=1 Tax=Aeromonas diversa TaxID=502790 RepID=UPI0005B84C86|nr:LysR substrate-binding domain-containing protein [Aeromonas diversa]